MIDKKTRKMVNNLNNMLLIKDKQCQISDKQKSDKQLNSRFIFHSNGIIEHNDASYELIQKGAQILISLHAYIKTARMAL